MCKSKVTIQHDQKDTFKLYALYIWKNSSSFKVLFNFDF